MTLESSIKFLNTYKPGTYVKIAYKDAYGMVKEHVVRLGLRYNNTKYYNNSHRHTNRLPYGEWIIDKYIIYHNGNLYLRFYKPEGVRQIKLSNVISIGNYC